MIIQGDALDEYKGELESMLKEYKKLEKAVKRMDEIKKRVKNIASVVGNDTDRVIFPLGSEGGWDRRVSLRDGGIDLEALKEAIGEERFKKLVCVKTVTYVPSPEKVEVARQEGKLTESLLKEVYVEGNPTFSLYKMTPQQVEKVEKEVE